MPISYGSTTTATITLNALAPGATAYTSAIDNSTDLFDALNIVLKIKPDESLTESPFITVGIAGSLDNSVFCDFSATEVNITNDNNLRKIFPSTSKRHYVTFENIPIYYKIYVTNRTGDTLTNSAGDNTLVYRGVVKEYTGA